MEATPSQEHSSSLAVSRLPSEPAQPPRPKSQTPSVESQLGLARLREHSLNLAETRLQCSLASQPDNHRTRHLLGITSSGLGKHKEALIHLTSALERSPTCPHILHDLGVALIRTGQVRLGEQRLREARHLSSSYRTWPVASLQDSTFSVERFDHRFKFIDYEYQPRVRYGGGFPMHQGLARIFEQQTSDVSCQLAMVSQYMDDFLRIPMQPKSPLDPLCWVNNWFLPLDGMALYAVLCHHNPRQMVEVGSGISTRFARLAIQQHQLSTMIFSIDPEPRSDIDDLVDCSIRVGLEDVDLNLVDTLEPGDIVFIDSSHRAFQNSDVTTFFMEILPRVAPGVLVHIHDIYLPEDYPAGNVAMCWNEQYLLATALLFGDARFRIIFPSWYVSRHPELCEEKDEILRTNQLSSLSIHGSSFWFTKEY